MFDLKNMFTATDYFHCLQHNIFFGTAYSTTFCTRFCQINLHFNAEWTSNLEIKSVQRPVKCVLLRCYAVRFESIKIIYKPCFPILLFLLVKLHWLLFSSVYVHTLIYWCGTGLISDLSSPSCLPPWNSKAIQGHTLMFIMYRSLFSPSASFKTHAQLYQTCW